jgi:hypothetical protein
MLQPKKQKAVYCTNEETIEYISTCGLKKTEQPIENKTPYATFRISTRR